MHTNAKQKDHADKKRYSYIVIRGDIMP